MGSVSVSSCRCCMFVSCVHPVAVLNARHRTFGYVAMGSALLFISRSRLIIYLFVLCVACLTECVCVVPVIPVCV